jgi:hypothetical protein
MGERGERSRGVKGLFPLGIFDIVNTFGGERGAVRRCRMRTPRIAGGFVVSAKGFREGLRPRAETPGPH